MECFNDLLLKLREVHEREMEGWQVKVQEMSNKKGCDTKRMEELFSRNQQMKDQQRVLTENIKTLENRLRAGLCDRCTVSQEIAKKRQQEFEASQIQSLQHISLLAGEMNSLKKENKRLKDEIKNLRAALDRSHSELSSSSTEVKPKSSPDLSSASVPVAIISTPTSRANSQPSDSSSAVKVEMGQRSEEAENRHVRGMNRSHFPFSLSALTLPHRKTEHATRPGEKRIPGAEGLEQRSSILSQALLLKNSSLSLGGDVNPSRHVLHAPVPCRPQPIKTGHVPLPWALPESCDWISTAAASAAAAGTSLVLQPSSKPNVTPFPNLIPTSQPASPRRQVFGTSWPQQTASQPHSKEPTVVFRLKSLQEHVESQTVPQEKKEILPLKVEKAHAWPRETCEGPLDLSDRGKSKSSHTSSDGSTLQGGEKTQKSPNKDVKTHSSPPVSISSPSPAMSPSSTPPVKEEDELATDLNHKEQREEVNKKTSQSSEKKVPVLTISLRPVVVLETLNSALQKQESLSTNGKESSPAAEPGSSSDEDQSVSGQENNQGCKRKRAAVEEEHGRDSTDGDSQHNRKVKMTMRSEENSSC